MKAGWKKVTFGDVCDFYRGLTYKKSDEVDFSSNIVLRANNISLESGALNFEELKYINENIAIADNKKIQKNTLLICTASGSKKHLGKVAFIDVDLDYAFGGFMGLLKPKANIDPKFFYWLTASKAYSDFIMALSDGANINNLKFSQLSQFEIPLPPLPEQKKIVVILDEAFAGIDQAIVNTEKNLASARKLFENFINGIFCSKHNDWINCTIGDVCKLKSGTTVPKDIEQSDGEIPYIKVAEMTMDENVDGIITSIRFLNNQDIKKSWLIPAGSTIFPKRGGAILTNKKRILLRDVCLDLNIMAVLPSEKILPEFLYIYFLNVDMSVLGSGSSIPQINNPDISPLKFSFPIELEEQRKIADQFNIFRAEYLRLSEIYEGKLLLLNQLKQSLLKKAFSGELTLDKNKLAEAAE